MKRLPYLLILVLLISCVEKEQDVIVTIDGSTFTKTQFEQYIPQSEYMKLTDEQLTEFLNNWADQEVLYLEAKKRGIEKEDSIQLVLDQYKRNLLAMELVRRQFTGTTVIESEIRDYFDKHYNEFLYAVKLAQIVLANYDLAVRTLEETKAGADFYKLAKERSLARLENPENPKIETDYLLRGTIADYATEEVIFSMKPGDISQVIPYLQGTYLIVKVINKRKVKAKAEYDDYRDAIYNYLLSKKYQDFLVQFVDDLKTQYKITIDLTPLRGSQ